MSTDAFINALRCSIAIRGMVQQLRCDQGTNFVSARNELKKSLKELDIERIEVFLAEPQCDFSMNYPHSSHVGGVWERQIRTIRSVLTSILHECNRLDTSSLRTFLYEAMAIVNSRPLTGENINDPNSPVPLTPNHLLTMKGRVSLLPPGNFVKEDIFAMKRWRGVQFLADQFWSRWKRVLVEDRNGTLLLRGQWYSNREQCWQSTQRGETCQSSKLKKTKMDLLGRSRSGLKTPFSKDPSRSGSSF